jgi:branched-chain amino acid aminotransferase
MPADFIQANTDGKLHDATKPSISPLNRGYLYGDAIYEVWRTYEGVIFAWDEHWARLDRSAKALDIALPVTQEAMFNEICRTAAAFCKKVKEKPELYIRLQISRGGGSIGLNPRLADKPGFTLLIQRLKPPTPEQFQSGIKLSVATALHRNHVKTLNPAWKTGNYLNNILCLREALSRGADDVVMTNLSGEITEASVSNIFFVLEDTLMTPPLSAGILEGVTRAALLGPVARAAGMRVRQEAIKTDELKMFSECFLSGTTREVLPVQSIDNVRYSVGPKTVSTLLRAAFADYTRQYVGQHPELRVFSRPARGARPKGAPTRPARRNRS